MGYLGIITIPLAFVGFIFGRRRWRFFLLGLFAVSASVLSMSAYSPAFSSLLSLVSPLRSVNHFGDSTYRLGGFLILVLAAGLGVEAIGYRRKFALPVALIFATLWFLLSTYWASAVYSEGQTPIYGSAAFGFFVVVAFLYSILGASFLTHRPVRGIKSIGVALIVLTMLDTSTMAYWWVRILAWGSHPLEYYAVNDDGIGLASSELSFYSNNLLQTSEISRLKRDFDPMKLPPWGIFTAARLEAGDKIPSYLKRSVRPQDRFALREIVLPQSLSNEQMKLVNPFLNQKGRLAAQNQVTIIRQRYNSTEFEVKADSPALFYWRDAWFPFWNGSVDGATTPLLPAFGAFKAVAVPKGTSVVRFSFSPPWIKEALILSYGLILGLAVAIGFNRALPRFALPSLKLKRALRFRNNP